MRAVRRALRVAVLLGLAAAQHVAVGAGQDEFGFPSDAWVGVLTGFAVAQSQLTLTQWDCRRPTRFLGELMPDPAGTLPPSVHGPLVLLSSLAYVASRPRGQILLRAGGRTLPFAQVPLGAHFRAFYMPHKEHGQLHNEVVLIGFMSPDPAPAYTLARYAASPRTTAR